MKQLRIFRNVGSFSPKQSVPFHTTLNNRALRRSRPGYKNKIREHYCCTQASSELISTEVCSTHYDLLLLLIAAPVHNNQLTINNDTTSSNSL